MDPEERGSRKELAGVEGEEIAIRVNSVRKGSTFNKMEVKEKKPFI